MADEDPYAFEVLEEAATLPPPLDEYIQKKIKEADEEDAATRVSLRWGREQLSLVRQAADAIGVSVDQYIKMAAYKMAVADLSRSAGLADAARINKFPTDAAPRTFTVSYLGLCGQSPIFAESGMSVTLGDILNSEPPQSLPKEVD